MRQNGSITIEWRQITVVKGFITLAPGSDFLYILLHAGLGRVWVETLGLHGQNQLTGQNLG